MQQKIGRERTKGARWWGANVVGKGDRQMALPGIVLKMVIPHARKQHKFMDDAIYAQPV